MKGRDKATFNNKVVKNMFKSLNKKVVIGLMAASIAISSIAAVPASAFAKENNGKGHGWGKNNFGQAISAEARLNHESEGENEDHEGKGQGLGSIFADLGIKSAAQAFRDSLKQAKEDKKTTNKGARTQLKTDLKSATTQDQKVSAVKTYFNSLLSAFQAFAAAKEAAFTQFINFLGGVHTNQAPTANAQSVTLNKNSSVAITLTGTDPEGSALTFSVVTSTSHGTLSGTVPNLSYLPSTDFTGSDSFTFKVNDGSLDSATATVNITVNP